MTYVTYDICDIWHTGHINSRNGDINFDPALLTLVLAWNDDILFINTKNRDDICHLICRHYKINRLCFLVYGNLWWGRHTSHLVSCHPIEVSIRIHKLTYQGTVSRPRPSDSTRGSWPAPPKGRTHLTKRCFLSRPIWSWVQAGTQTGRQPR